MSPTDLRQTLAAFEPLLRRDFGPAVEEAEANKRFILSDRVFTYLPTLGGHEPIWAQMAWELPPTTP